MDARLQQIVGHFATEGTVTDIRPLGNGLINDTFLVVTDGPDNYVLQRINQSIFQDVDLLQHNIDCVTRHIREKLVAAGETDIDRKVLRFLPERTTGKSFWTDGKEWWRVSVFIRDALTFEAVTPEYAGYAGVAFGQFEAMLADLPDKLGEPIPDFHNMELRARQLREAVAADAAGRMADPEVRSLVAEIQSYEEEMCKAERMYREGILPKRICHCDTKVNNMLFDKNGNVLCIIDLDTVMPAYVFSDYGDFLRTAANSEPEDSPELDRITFRWDIFEAFTRGYLESTASFLTSVEREHLPFAVTLFPMMQAVRFLTDYLNGDTYYKILYPEHNLVRSRNQLRYFEQVETRKGEMERFVKGMA